MLHPSIFICLRFLFIFSFLNFMSFLLHFYQYLASPPRLPFYIQILIMQSYISTVLRILLYYVFLLLHYFPSHSSTPLPLLLSLPPPPRPISPLPTHLPPSPPLPSPLRGRVLIRNRVKIKVSGPFCQSCWELICIIS